MCVHRNNPHPPPALDVNSPDCLRVFFSGAVKLRLEQEGEAQLRSQRCCLHAQVQPGERRSVKSQSAIQSYLHPGR